MACVEDVSPRPAAQVPSYNRHILKKIQLISHVLTLFTDSVEVVDLGMRHTLAWTIISGETEFTCIHLPCMSLGCRRKTG